jgi:hypothetical protein
MKNRKTRRVAKIFRNVNYDRIFVKDISKFLKPLYDLLKKDSRFHWSDKHQEAFKKIYGQRIYN